MIVKSCVQITYKIPKSNLRKTAGHHSHNSGSLFKHSEVYHLYTGWASASDGAGYPKSSRRIGRDNPWAGDSPTAGQSRLDNFALANRQNGQLGAAKPRAHPENCRPDLGGICSNGHRSRGHHVLCLVTLRVPSPGWQTLS